MGAKVYGIDRVKDNYRVQQFLDGHLHKPIQDYDCIEFIKNIQPTVVVHCASDIQVGESVQDPGKYYDNNVGGTVTFLEYVRQACDKLPLVLFSSSAGMVIPLMVHQPQNSHPLNQSIHMVKLN